MMGGSPTIDFSKYENAPQIDFSKYESLPVPKNNPTPQQNLSRTNANMALAMSGQQAQMSPQDQAQFEAGRKAGTISGGGTVALGALGGVGAALTAPTAATETVGTGLLDAAGEEIKREVLKYGPSIGKQAAATAVKWVASNPVSAALGYHLARKLGVPLPQILDVLGAMGETLPP